MKLIEKLKKLDACSDGIKYIRDQTALDAWSGCERGDLMLSIAARQQIDLKVLTGIKVKCARLVEHLMTDERSINALKVGDDFSNGIATLEELKAAASAAYAASAAASAAAYAAYAAAYAADDAASASAAASAAAYAADDAASSSAAADISQYSKTLKQCADICRQHIPFELLNLDD